MSVERRLEELAEQRRKLLELYYADRLSPELFAEEEARLSRQMEALRREREEREAERSRLSEVAARFEEVARILREMDVDRLWAEATEQERRVLVEELLECVAMYPDQLEAPWAACRGSTSRLKRSA
jgi:intergrase/recombinase